MKLTFLAVFLTFSTPLAAQEVPSGFPPVATLVAGAPGPWQMILSPNGPIPGTAWVWNAQTGEARYCAPIPLPVCVVAKIASPPAR